ncbi:hypothetical protein ACO0LL_18910 [Undibacterium sp. TC4M20W]|uniref:hypothetical protein n=1 Tax=unclassified Undibacterium TaxID=2630295 RepID=UPI003BF05D0F
MGKKITENPSDIKHVSSADFKDELDKLISRLPSMSDMEISAAKDKFLRRIDIALSKLSS